MQTKRKRGRPAKPKKHEEEQKEGTNKNNGKREKDVEVMDSSLSASLNNQPKRKRGRPAKPKKHEEEQNEGTNKNNGKREKDVEVMDSSLSASLNNQPKRKRGRPAKPKKREEEQNEGTNKNNGKREKDVEVMDSSLSASLNNQTKRKRGRPTKPKKHEEEQKEGTTKNNGKREKEVEVMDSSLSASLNNQSDSWECPLSLRKYLILDSTMISGRRDSLRLKKRHNEIETSSASRFSHAQKSGQHLSTAAVLEQLDGPVDTNINSAYQAPASYLEFPSRCPIQVANPSTLTPGMMHEATEKVGNYFAPMDKPEVGEAHVAEISMLNDQMEGPETFQAECIALQQQPLAEVDIQAINHSEDRTNKNHSKYISVVAHPSMSSCLKLTEVINLLNDDDEINSVGQRLPVDTVDKYQVKPELMSILRKLLSSHGDVVQNCTLLTIKSRSKLLESICEFILELQEKGFSETKEDHLQDMIALVNDMKNKNVNVEWLQQRLLEILEASQTLKQSGMLKEKRECNRKILKNVEQELKEKEEEIKALTAKLQSLHDEKTVCKEKLDRVRDESSSTTATIADAMSKVKRFLNCSLVDGLL